MSARVCPILLEHIGVPSLEAAATTLNLDARLSKRDDEPLLRSAHCARRVPRIAIKAIGRDAHYVAYRHRFHEVTNQPTQLQIHVLR